MGDDEETTLAKLDIYKQTYHDLIEDIRFTKRQLWLVVYYLVAFHFALCALSVDPRWNCDGVKFLILSYVVWTIGMVAFFNYRRDLKKYRDRSNCIKEVFNDVYGAFMCPDEDDKAVRIDLLIVALYISLSLVGPLALILLVMKPNLLIGWGYIWIYLCITVFVHGLFVYFLYYIPKKGQKTG